MTLSEMQAIVARRLGDDSVAMRALATDWLNLTQRAMVPLVPWNDLLVTSTLNVTGVSTALPAGYVRLYGNPVLATTGAPIFSAKIHELRTLAATPAGPPQYYAVVFDAALATHQFRVRPNPDVSYLVDFDYIQGAVDLVNGTDRPVFPDVYHHILVTGAVEMGKDFDAKTDRPVEYQKYQDMLAAVVRQAASFVRKT